MFYIKLENGSPVGYPIIEQNLLEVLQVPEITEELLTSNGFARVERPELSASTQVVQELGFAMGDDGIVRPVLQTVEMTQEEKVEHWIRRPRNHALAASDWTQMADSPLSAEKKAEWAEFRQALRDMTTVNANVQDPADIVAPTPPAP